ncbi:flavodoxin [Kitasatospora griseola]|nr:flavodoxin [Kitasatospora griseola]
MNLAALRLPDFRDECHGAGDAGAVGESDEELLREATVAATDIVIASPLYWYSVSAHTKRYRDYWSKWLRTPGPDFRAKMAGRTLWGVTAMAHAGEGAAEPLVLTLHHTAAYLGMRFGGVLLGHGTRPGQVLADEDAVLRAKTFFTQSPPQARFPWAS